MEDKPRLIEHAFPLEQVSLDSVHEKNVRHGHISTLHIWPARRPLAACRAALIATLLPDPGTPEKRKELVEKIGGVVREKTEKKRMPNGKLAERLKRYTEGGILDWDRAKANSESIAWFRDQICKAYGGRAPRVLDPFAGGGAIPLEAMRLGCEVTAIDINPVAWFILKCTLEYPQKLADQKRPLPHFVIRDRQFMETFLKAQGFNGATLKTQLKALGLGEDSAPHFESMAPEPPSLQADLAWHVRAWGVWVHKETRKHIAQFYPAYADFESPKESTKHFKTDRRRQVPLKNDGMPDIESLNAELSPDKQYIEDLSNPRWLLKPTVAYLWARTVTCKNCRASVPLLKTRWLCRKPEKRIILTLQPTLARDAILFGVETAPELKGGNAAQRREHDKKLAKATMSRSGAKCPCCDTIMTMQDIRMEGQAGRLGATMTAVVEDTGRGNAYRTPTAEEIAAVKSAEEIPAPSSSIDVPMEPASTRSISCQLYGVRTYRDLFTRRQVVALNQFKEAIHAAYAAMGKNAYPPEWRNALGAYLALSFDRLLAFTCVNVRWKTDAEAVVDAFARFSISLLWDFAEPQPVGDRAGSWPLCFERIATALDTYNSFASGLIPPTICQTSAASLPTDKKYDLILTDPPYYQAISYADLSDFFYVWLREVHPWQLHEFSDPTTPKTQEIVQHIRQDKDRQTEKKKYEDCMYEVFKRGRAALAQDGRFVCVFAHKDPLAWETLVSAMIRAGLVVEASWPIQTEMVSRQRASASAALASSVWLVCKKRPDATKVGWDKDVIADMQQQISLQLRLFWDAGIRGPDFVWAATGPALESYSKYPAVKKARDPGKLMDVSEFLRQVRRIVVDFVVGRVLSPDKDSTEATGLDDVTTYYLLHRHDFQMEEAPAGPCILYAVSCNLSDAALADQYDILARVGGNETDEDEEDEPSDEEPDAEVEERSGSKLRLKNWNQRTNPMMGYDPSVDSARARSDAMQMKFLEESQEPPRRRQIPLIDQIHRLMHLWKAGDVAKVDDYLEVRALVRHKTFLKLLQALIELAPQGSDERSMLEKISNHIAARGGTDQMVFDVGNGTDNC